MGRVLTVTASNGWTAEVTGAVEAVWLPRMVRGDGIMHEQESLLTCRLPFT
jgi:hypothetical protein